MMNRVIIKQSLWGEYPKYCPFCGLNTLLLRNEECIHIGNKTYCRSCYETGNDKKTIIPKDFYDMFFEHIARHEDFCLQMETELLCKYMPRVLVAHLYGELEKEDDFRLDIKYDKKNDKLYFRIYIVDDPEPWFGRENYCFITMKQAICLLNRNGIHIWDEMNEENWKEFFEF